MSLSGKTEEVGHLLRIFLPKVFSALTSLFQIPSLVESGEEKDVSVIKAEQTLPPLCSIKYSKRFYVGMPISFIYLFI